MSKIKNHLDKKISAYIDNLFPVWVRPNSCLN
jgi:hypothetical protein